MTILFLFQKGAPDLTNAILILLGILFTLLLVNSFYEWFRAKPWQNKDNSELPVNDAEVIHGNENTPPNPRDKNSSDAQNIDYQSLGLPIGC